MSGEDLSQFSMLDLFRAELETQSQSLTAGLLALERDPVAADQLEACMRAAHSLKGAARIIDLEPAVRIADAMEEILVAAQHGKVRLRHQHIDTLLKGIDLLALAASDTPPAAAALNPEIARLRRALEPNPDGTGADPHDEPTPLEAEPARGMVAQAAGGAPQPGAPSERMVRITADAMTRLLGLAGESLTEARRLRPFADRLQRLKRHNGELARAFDELRATLRPAEDERVAQALMAMQDKLIQSRDALNERLDELAAVDRRTTDLANRLYAETLASRMRPFEDGVRHFTRIVRDLGRALGKQVSLEIIGGSTGIDRDILDQLDAPLGHLLRNAVDHGLETPEARIAAGKPPECLISLEAQHSAGVLLIIVSDDGKGIDLEQLRHAIVVQQLTTQATAESLSEAELLAFLFLPGFSMKPTVSDISGRGVGLDAVQAMAKQVRGVVSVSSTLGVGTRFQLQLPLTLSVVRTLMVEIADEPYALPLAGLNRTLKLPRDAIEMLEGRAHFRVDQRQIGLITAHEILDRGEARSDETDLSIAIIGEGANCYGLVVDRFLGERELVVRPLDPRLGKIKDVSAAALIEDGSPVLILDTDDLLRSAEKLTASGRLSTVKRATAVAGEQRRKRVLVVDDSLTVRELERKLLDQHGYTVEVAVDGMDGWNALRSDTFDLVVTDIDMPRMDGIELTTLIKADRRLQSIPVMIVSYKDREEDRRRGLDAGADYYLTKGSFHDDTLIEAVADLIGPASD